MNPSGTILAIDNDTPTVDFIADVLMDEGYLVHTVTQAEYAVMLARTTQPDLVLCDLHMPHQDGVSLIADLRAYGRIDAPIIMMTADVHAASELAMDGIDFCLIKPFILGDLIDCVAKYIRQAV